MDQQPLSHVVPPTVRPQLGPVMDEVTFLSLWRQQLRLTVGRPWLLRRWLESSQALLQRLQRIYRYLCQQPRPIRRRLQRQLGASLAGAALALALANSPVQAASIVVDNATCTLAEAIISANNDNASGNGCTDGSGADTISFAASLISGGDATISLTQFDTGLDNGEVGPTAFTINSNVTIAGPSGENGITIARASGPSNFRLFHVQSGGTLALTNLTLSGGIARGGNGGQGDAGGGGGAGLGGAIFNEGTLTLQHTTLSGHLAVGGDGSTNNGGYSGGGGGGLGAGGGAGSSGGAGAGGGPNSGSAGSPGGFGGGGGGGNSSGATGGAGGFGGGGGGGAGFNGSSPLSGTGGAGGFGGGGGAGGFDSGSGGPGGFGAGAGRNYPGNGGGGAGLGGALFNLAGVVTISNSTISGNTAQGGSGGNNGSGMGGGLFNRNGTVTITNATIASNVVTGGSPNGGGIVNLGDGATATLTLNGTIVADSTVATNDFVGTTINGGTNTTSGSGNLIEAQSGFAGTVVSSADPILAALADNGGPTATHALTSGSPAIDAAGDSGLADDQRGIIRPRGLNDDIGAFELELPVNSNITVQGTPTTQFNAAPDATYGAQSPAGVYTITATFRNVANPAVALHDVYFKVKGIDHTGGADNYLLNADGGPGQVGAQLSIANSSLPGGDELWSQNEDLAAQFVIGLDERRRFTLMVDVYGVEAPTVAAAGAGAPPVYLYSFVFTADPAADTPGQAQRIFLPMVNN